MPLNQTDREQIRQMIAEQVAPIAIQRVELEEIKAATRALQIEVSHLIAAVEQNGRQITRLQEENARTNERMERGFAELREENDRGFAELREENARGFAELRGQIGALTEAYGLDLEDVGAYVVPHYLRHEEGFEVGPLDVHHLTLEGEPVGIDLFGEPRRGGRRFTVVAEVKSRVHIREVRALIQRNLLLARQLPAGETELLAVLFPRRIHPEARELATEAGMRLIPWDYPYRMARE